MTIHAAMADWLDRRVGWSALRAALAARSVRPPLLERYLRAAVLLLFVLLVLSGMGLASCYRPEAGAARQSLVALRSAVPFGALARGVHAWSADLLVAAALAHVFVLAERRGYRHGGELGWVAALLVAGLAMALAFSGALLPWSREAQAHALVAGGLLAQVPLAGAALQGLLLGGAELTAATPSRAFGLHAVALPVVMTALLAAHRVLLGPADAIAAAATPAARARMPLWPDFAARVVALSCGLLAAVLGLAALWPRPVGEAGEPALALAAGLRAPWYLLFVHSLLGAAPATTLGLPSARVLAGVAVALLGLLALLPLVDRRGSPVVRVAAWAALATLGALSIHALV